LCGLVCIGKKSGLMAATLCFDTGLPMSQTTVNMNVLLHHSLTQGDGQTRTVPRVYRSSATDQVMCLISILTYYKDVHCCIEVV